MSFTVQELRRFAREIEHDSETEGKTKFIVMAAFALRWSAVALFLLSLALTLGWLYYFYNYKHINGGVIKVAFVLAIPTCMLGYAIFITRIRPPEGLRVSREQAPKLWAEVDAICRKADYPPPAAIILDDDLNAAAAVAPRSRLSPISDTYLILGLPLLLSMSPLQARAVIGHEIGHFAKQHSRAGRKVYGALEVAGNIIAQFSEGGFIQRAIARLYAQAARALRRHSLDLSRANEFQADRFSARLVGAPAMGAALCQLDAAGSVLKSEPRLLKADRAHFESLDGRAAAQLALAAALREEDDFQRTHPPLRARLAALGIEPHLPEPVGADHAAAAWLPDIDGVIAHFDEIRAEQLKELDAAKAKFQQEAARTLEELEKDSEKTRHSPPLEAGRLSQAANAALNAQDLARARDLALQAEAVWPHYSITYLVLGRICAEQWPLTAIEHFLRASEMCPETARIAVYEAGVLLDAQPDDPETAVLRARLATIEQALPAAMEERNADPCLREEFLGADLSEEAAEALEPIVRGNPDILGMTLVRRSCGGWAQTPAFVMALRLRTGSDFGSEAQNEIAQKRFDDLIGAIHLFGTVAIFYPESAREHLVVKKMQRAPGAIIYLR